MNKKFDISLTKQEFRYLLDLVYIGNWILNAARGEDRINEYDKIESLIFSLCKKIGFKELSDDKTGTIPSWEYQNGGIHEAIMDYEDTVFFGILAEELAQRDISYAAPEVDKTSELQRLIEKYLENFNSNGIENVYVEEEA